MKIFNPFKPHIAVNGLGQYLVREYSFTHWPFGWSYYDRDGTDQWFGHSSVDRWCTCTSGEAKLLIEKISANKLARETYLANKKLREKLVLKSKAVDEY